VSEQFLNGTSAHKRPFSALQVLIESNEVICDSLVTESDEEHVRCVMLFHTLSSCFA